MGLAGMMSLMVAAMPAQGYAPEDESVLRDYLSGNGLLNRGLFELAAAEYGKFLGEHSDHAKAPLARYGLGVCEFRLGQHGAAAKTLRMIERLKTPAFPYPVEVAVLIGQCELSLQRPAAAVDAFSGVVSTYETHPLAPDAAAGWAEALYLSGQHKAVVPVVDRMAKSWPKSPRLERAQFFAGLALQATGDDGAAADRFENLVSASAKGPFAPQATLQLARCRHRLGALDQALQRYAQAASASAVRPDALLGWAVVLQEQGQHDKAQDKLDQLLAAKPSDLLRRRAQLERGRCLFNQDQLDEAVVVFEMLRNLGGERADEAAYMLGKCRLRQGRHKDAARALRMAIDEFPDSPLIAKMRYDRAVALVQADSNDAPAGLKEYLEHHDQHALVPAALHTLASFSHHRGRYKDSLEHCRAFLSRYDGHADSSDVAFLQAENRYLLGQYDQAAGLYTAFRAKYRKAGQDGLAGLRAGMAYYHRGRHDEAQPLLAEAVSAGVTERSRPALLALGDIHFSRSEWKKAATHLRAFLDAGVTGDPAADAWIKLGLSLQRQSQLEPALSAYDALLKSYPTSAHAPQAWFERGQVLALLGRSEDAEAAFRKIVETYGDSRFNAHALKHLGTLTMQQNRYDEAAAFYQQIDGAEGTSTSRADASFDRGQALMAARKYEQAAAVFEAFLRNQSNHDHADAARAHRAIALARMDRREDALEAASTVKQPGRLNPTLAATLYYEKAWCARHINKSDMAAAAYIWLLKNAAQTKLAPHAQVELAELAYDAGAWAVAAGRLEKLAAMIEEGRLEVSDTVQEQGLYMRGVCCFQQAQFDTAAEHLGEMITRFPQSGRCASARFFAGESRFKLKEYDAAATHLSQLVEQFPSDSACSPGMLRLGESLAHLQRWSESEAVFKSHIERFPSDDHWFQARFGLAWAIENQQRYADAMAQYARVIDNHSGETAARSQFQIGECLYAMNKHDQAAAEFLKVDIHYAYPQWSAAALYEAARCFEAMTRVSEARAQYQRVVEHHDNTQWASLSKQRLNALPRTAVPGH
jgi:TolA-binding protein